jgi:DNA-directed RNA polymerase specialized sigma24 family protein
MSYAESAAMLGTTTGKVRVKCFRAREALRELLARTDSAAAAEGGGLG